LIENIIISSAYFGIFSQFLEYGIWNDQNVGIFGIFGMELEFHGIPAMYIGRF
jgi:hypothetical protein